MCSNSWTRTKTFKSAFWLGHWDEGNSPLMQQANTKLAGTYRVQIKDSAHQDDDKGNSKDGKVQHDCSLLSNSFC